MFTEDSEDLDEDRGEGEGGGESGGKVEQVRKRVKAARGWTTPSSSSSSVPMSVPSSSSTAGTGTGTGTGVGVGSTENASRQIPPIHDIQIPSMSAGMCGVVLSCAV